MYPGKDKLQVRLPQTPAIPQQLLASVSAGLSEGAQRLSKHLHTHVLSQNPLQISAKLQLPSQPISQRTRDAGNRRNQVLLEEEGVTVAVQVPPYLPQGGCTPAAIALLLNCHGQKICNAEVLHHAQARHNVHKSVLSLGAAVLGKISRLGHKLKQHHAHAREEGALPPPTASLVASRAGGAVKAPQSGKEDCHLPAPLLWKMLRRQSTEVLS